LKRYGEIDFEYVFLSDYHLEFCRGCKLCFVNGEEYCPLKDDRDILLEKIAHSDGVIFATPNYAYQVSARLKNFFERTAFFHHRPKYFDKSCTSIVVQGFRGGDNILKYLSSVCESMGFQVSRGCCTSTLDPMTELQRERLARNIQKTSAAFYKTLLHPTPSPSFLKLMLFRFVRTYVKTIDQKYVDYHYYKKMGWFESDYYYATSLNPIKRLAGKLFDLLGRRVSKMMGGGA
jgi:multimeric flavodoxin WrbA